VTNVEQSVRTALNRRADAVETTPLSGPQLRARASAHRRKVLRTSLIAAVASATALAALLAVPSVVKDRSLPPATSTVDGWPVRGDLAGDTTLAAAARRAWDAAPVLPGELPRRDIRVLLAARTSFGRYVVLTGLNRLGHRRLAVLSDDPRDHAPYAKRLRLRSDQAFPADDDLLTYLEQRRVGSEPRALLLVVGPPEVTRMRWHDQFTTWNDLPSTGGVAAWVVASDYPDLRVRAYRGTRRVAQQRTSAPYRSDLYRPDQALVPATADQPDSCHDGVCEAHLGGTMSAVPDRPGDVANVHRAPDALWEDMSDQAEQLWINWALNGVPANSWRGGGMQLSTLLPDDTGVHLSTHAVNDLPDHLILYVDRPEWPIGKLYLAKPYDPDHPPRAVTALVVANDTLRLVAFAGNGVTIRYRTPASGGWHPVRIDDGIGTAVLVGHGYGTDAVDVAVTYHGETKVGKLDAADELRN
jgi:hypothetical protein